MSIAILFDLQLEVRRLFIAGSRMAEGDVRLQKLMPVLQQLGESAPVFKRVAQALQEVVEPESPHEGAAVKLLELSTLLDSILYTQGTTELGVEGIAIEGTELAGSTPIPYRKLGPVMEALTTKGQGRMERISQAYEDHLLQDFRVVPAAVAALDDGYAEIADFAYGKVIPAYGKDALPALQSQLDLNGGRAHGRRLQLLHNLRGSAEMALYLQAAREGSVEVRSAAIELLGHYPEQEELILAQADEKKKEIRQAAFAGLARLGTARAADRLYLALTTSRDREMAVDAIRSCDSVDLISKVIANAEQAIIRIAADAGKDREEAIAQLLADVECLEGKPQSQTLDFLKLLLAASEIMIPETDRIQEKAAQQLLWMNTPDSLAYAIALQQLYNGRFTGFSFLAAYRTLPADEVYVRFSPVLAEKKKTPAKELLLTAIHQVMPSWSEQIAHASTASTATGWATKLDARWIALFAEIDQEELVWSLADKPDKRIAAYLHAKFQQKPRFGMYRTTAILLALFRSGHQEAPELLMSLLEKDTAKTLYYLNDQQRTLLYLLPRSYADRLKTFAESLSYENIQQQVLEIAGQIAEKPELATAEKGTGLWGWIRNKMS